MFWFTSNGRIAQELRTLVATLKDLTEAVHANTSALESAKTALAGLAAKVEANKTDPVALQALVDELKSGDDSLAAAIVANTQPAPVDPVPTPEPAPAA